MLNNGSGNTCWTLPEGKFDQTEQQLFALLDSAQVPKLISRIYEQEGSPEAVAIYAETELSQLINVSPWLVKITPETPLINWILQTVVPAHGAVLLQSEATMAELVQHWQHLRYVYPPEGALAIGRLHDPRVLLAVLKATSSEQLSSWMGPASNYWLPDYNNNSWQCIDNPLPEPASGSLTDFYHLSESQMDAIHALSRQQSAAKLAAHIRQYFPQQAENNTQDQALRYMKQAAKLGFTTRQNQYYYTNIICILGEQAILNQHYPAISTLLHQPCELTPSQRIQKAAEQAAMIAEKAEGSRYV